MKYQTVRLLAAFLGALTAQSAFAAPVEVSACYARAGRDYGIDPDLLLAIGIQESRLNNKAINNGSFDYCQMQVNQIHTGELKDFGINLKELTHKPCTCIYSGTWVLAKFFQRYGRSWNTVGMYNAGVKNSPGSNRARANYAKTIRGIYTVIKMEKKESGDKSLALLNETKPRK
ncbi:lytic transglycosylase domain-containing protein [Pantoea agglomerans]|uniref:lytic transglycosylase domain-containing protein n=1 Tax=Enterobacter agglomerans TaxID=549 RepID=UPI003209A643